MRYRLENKSRVPVEFNIHLSRGKRLLLPNESVKVQINPEETRKLTYYQSLRILGLYLLPLPDSTPKKGKKLSGE